MQASARSIGGDMIAEEQLIHGSLVLAARTLPPRSGLCEARQPADSPELREKLLNLAREWMHAVMDVEDAASAKEGQWSKAPKQRSSGGSTVLMSTEPN